MTKSIFITGSSSKLFQQTSPYFLNNFNEIILAWHKNKPSLLTQGNNYLNANKTKLIKLDLRKSNHKLQMPDDLHSFIHFASINEPQLLVKSPDKYLEESLSIQLSNLISLLQQSVIPNFIKNQHGHLIFISSLQWQMGGKGSTVYATIKSCLQGFIKSLARELGPYGVCVNCIYPGFFESNQNKKLSEKEKKLIYEKNVLEKSSNFKEIGSFLRWLLSTSHISGQSFNLDSRITPF